MVIKILSTYIEEELKDLSILDSSTLSCCGKSRKEAFQEIKDVLNRLLK
jgi:hypothetical protein